MGKNHVIILAITQQGLSYRQAAKQYGVSKSWVHKIHKRYLHEGADAFWAQSRKPHTSPRRTHRSIGRNTPATVYGLIPKATPTGSESIWKVRYDKVNEGRITLRYGNKMLHLGVGRQHEREEVIALVKDKDVTIIDYQGTVLGEYEIDPNTNYQPKK